MTDSLRTATACIPAPSASVRRRVSGTPLHDRLRAAILAGELELAGGVSQHDLARALGVSQAPLREALRLLEQEGLVELGTDRRPRVVPLAAHDLDDVYGMRIMLEALAATLSVPLLSDEEIAELQSCAAEMERLAVHDDVAGWERPHARFHQLLAVHAGPRIARQVAALADHAGRYRARLLREPGAWQTGIGEHDEILEACRARDAVLVRDRLARHLARTALTIVAQLWPGHEPVAVRGALRVCIAPPTDRPASSQREDPTHTSARRAQRTRWRSST